MPDRIIRDELLRSHKYRTLTSDTARLLFIHILLTVDALGNSEADTTAISDVIKRPIDEVTMAKLLSELADADLIRMYEVAGKPYLHVPRFRQRLRYMKGKHPRPPASIECKEISELLTKVGPQSDHSRTTVRRSEVKRSTSTTTSKDGAVPAPVGELFPDAKTAMWEQGVRVLRAHGNSEQASRSLLGKLQKEHGVEKLAAAIAHLSIHPKIEPKAYLIKMLRPETPEEREARASAALRESALRSLW